MNLALFFDPIHKDHYEEISNNQHLFLNGVRLFEGDQLNAEEADIAIFSINEYRGVTNDPVKSDRIRTELYSLAKGKGEYKIFDLGVLRIGETRIDTLHRIEEIVSYLIENKILPIIIGGADDLSEGIYAGYNNSNKIINWVNVDADFDIHTTKEFASSKHVFEILTKEETHLNSYTHLAHQGFLINRDALSAFEKMNLQTYRLGELKSNIDLVEPDLRTADMFTFDLSAIKYSESKGGFTHHPFGLDAAEACQLCWYAGMSNQLSSCLIGGYNEEKDESFQTSKIAATMIWHIIDGYYNETESLYFDGSEYDKFIVTLEHQPNQIIFYKGKQSGKWWMNIGEGIELNVSEIIPCNYTDYLTCTKGEIPERYILALQKL